MNPTIPREYLLHSDTPPPFPAHPLTSPADLQAALAWRLHLYGVAVVEWVDARSWEEGAVSGVVIDGMVERQRRRRARALVTEAAHWPDGRPTPPRGEAE